MKFCPVLVSLHLVNCRRLEALNILEALLLVKAPHIVKALHLVECRCSASCRLSTSYRSSTSCKSSTSCICSTSCIYSIKAPQGPRRPINLIKEIVETSFNGLRALWRRNPEIWRKTRTKKRNFITLMICIQSKKGDIIEK